MPSGSHGGRSGGSHGGFSGGGGSRSFGGFRSSSSHHHRPRGPRYVRWFGGRTVIISTGRQSVLSIIAFFMIMCLLAMFPAWSSVSEIKSDIKMIKEEQAYYLDMIENAENDPSYQVMGEVTGVFYKQEYERYYITYEFGDEDFEGYTFSIYTRENCPSNGSSILLAVDEKNIDDTTDSIPMDYKNFTLEDDGEYNLYVKNLKNVRTVAIVATLIFVGLIALIVVVVSTAKKKEEEKEQQEKEENEKKQIEEEKKKFCQYCGAKVDPNEPVCGQCGAKTL